MDMWIRSVMALLVLATVPAALAQTPPPHSPTPVEPIAAVIDALRTHDVVGMSDPHGNEQMQALLLKLVRAPGFADAVNDIVIETASARYQDAIDRFVRGEDVPGEVLRKAWEEHTVVNSLGHQAEEFIRAVRAVNGSLGGGRKLRVIAGDPPIDWDNVSSRDDHRRWIELRDSYPADVIRRQVLDRGRRALVIYGQGHLQRRQIASNYDMSFWQEQTVVSLLGRDPAVRVFTVWSLFGRGPDAAAVVASWPVPSLAVTRGTTLGGMDFATYNAGLGNGTRFAVRNDQIVPLPRDAWQTMRMEDEFDAVLYLGPPSTLTNAPVSAALCQDRQFANSRLERLTRFAPPVEVENFKKACGL